MKNWEYVPGKIDKQLVRHPNGVVEEWVGCEIDVYGELVAGKIDKKVIFHPNGDRQEEKTVK